MINLNQIKSNQININAGSNQNLNRAANLVARCWMGTVEAALALAKAFRAHHTSLEAFAISFLTPFLAMAATATGQLGNSNHLFKVNNT
jgi:hypothetical protein